MRYRSALAELARLAASKNSGRYRRPPTRFCASMTGMVSHLSPAIAASVGDASADAQTSVPPVARGGRVTVGFVRARSSAATAATAGRPATTGDGLPPRAPYRAD